ncbi:interferon regulatory factor 2 [Aplysia californica]|uniref:Interferon regulatory factor 2 n=1 Tax=Aplysia californica TaxID=6500 RepID=A0ABM0ZUB9_APLCA|nr:interferon regulatory factor 2 [Aplysia californica]
MAPRRESILIPFLYRMIGWCPGVVWENQQESMFRVPWKKSKSRGWKPADSQIFLEWARHTGKFKKGDTFDYPAWRVRLRCTLNKSPEIREVKKLHRKVDPNPYQVYQFVRSSPPRSFSADDDFVSNTCSSVSIAATPASSGSQPSPVILFEEIDRFLDNTSPQPPNNISHQHLPWENPQITSVVLNRAENNVTASLTHPPLRSELNQPPLQTIPNENFTCEMVDQQANEVALGEVGFPSFSSVETNQSMPSDLRSVKSDDLVRPASGENVPSLPSLNTPDTSLGSYTSTQPGGNRENNIVVQTIPSPAEESVFSFCLWYGFNQRLLVKEGRISSQGCLFTDPIKLQQKMCGPTEMEQIEMPMVDQCYGYKKITERETKLISVLLENMGKGLILTVKDDVVHATRLCKTNIFLSDKKSKSSKLECGEQKSVPILDVKQNCDSFVYLTFGREITKHHEIPLRGVPICLKIEHLLKSKQKMMVQDTNTDSYSPELLISGNDDKDPLSDQFKSMNVCDQ